MKSKCCFAMSKAGKGLKTVATIAASVFMLAVQPMNAVASVQYMPDVTAEMNTPEFWLMLRGGEADTILADQGTIQRINAANLANEKTNMNDLRNYSEITDVMSFNARLLEESGKDLKSYQEKGYFDRYGNILSDELIQAIVLNTQNQTGVQSMAPMYGIAVKRSLLCAFPTDAIITDEQGDLNFDYNALSGVRVNEPLVIRTVSADGQWYYALSANCSGWVKVSDVAICSSKSEWLNAWDIPAERCLVVTRPRLMLAESNTNPELSNLVLTMGTVLEQAPAGSIGNRITNRSSVGNYVVYIPVRGADGRYIKETALVSAIAGVHEGYLPLTTRNIITVAFNMLGETYGWGGMLSSNDCSGYMTDVYRCFGLVLPRNTTWQAASDAFNFDVTDLPDEQKASILNNMPIGSILFLKGHEMMYLGMVNGKYYVVSASSSIGSFDGTGTMRTRSVIINTLDIQRANRATWMNSIYKMQIPYWMF
ncbi:cell wall-associated hydrolase, invasion-associated protein [Lachnospiraceae bacterium JC7]|nr:cell wall-associated hydrolase, invasion-associated protein [Lachnospiraceae bacterium JC7]